MRFSFGVITTISVARLVSTTASDCVGTISSLDDVATAVQCTTVNLNSFTVPGGQALTLDLLTGTTVTMYGDIYFGNLSWVGPLFIVSGNSVVFNGNGYLFDGGGPFYWDGLGQNGGIQKPSPMMKIKISGTYANVTVVNSPARVYSVSNPAPLLMTNLTVDNSQGDVPNNQSNGLPAGAVFLQDTTLTALTADDCLAINKGSNIVFTNNTCINGHGISVGSIASNVTVSDIVISGNTIIDNDQALRIKTDATATNSTISNITYAGNTATGMRQFGVLIDQSYPHTLSVPGNGVIISGVNFVPPLTSITVNDDAEQIAVNCGLGSCVGSWNWSYLEVSGGAEGPINNFTGIVGFTQS